RHGGDVAHQVLGHAAVQRRFLVGIGHGGHGSQLRSVPGSHRTISGHTARAMAHASSRKKNGSVARATKLSERPVIDWITNRLKPTGGVICAISTTTTRKMPNQIAS